MTNHCWRVNAPIHTTDYFRNQIELWSCEVDMGIVSRLSPLRIRSNHIGHTAVFWTGRVYFYCCNWGTLGKFGIHCHSAPWWSRITSLGYYCTIFTYTVYPIYLFILSTVLSCIQGRYAIKIIKLFYYVSAVPGLFVLPPVVQSIHPAEHLAVWVIWNL